jgi:hypothetical protein
MVMYNTLRLGTSLLKDIKERERITKMKSIIKINDHIF